MIDICLQPTNGVWQAKATTSNEEFIALADQPIEALWSLALVLANWIDDQMSIKDEIREQLLKVKFDG